MYYLYVLHIIFVEVDLLTLKIIDHYIIIFLSFLKLWINAIDKKADNHFSRIIQEGIIYTDIMKHSLILLPFFIGSITAWTSCPDLRGIPDFQVLDYTGRWFEYASTSTNYSQGGNDDSCVRALYSDNGDGVIGVFNEAIM